jgi:hypothetical protein
MLDMFFLFLFSYILQTPATASDGQSFKGATGRGGL